MRGLQSVLAAALGPRTEPGRTHYKESYSIFDLHQAHGRQVTKLYISGV
jgi:hypothetical protein